MPNGIGNRERKWHSAQESLMLKTPKVLLMDSTGETFCFKCRDNVECVKNVLPCTLVRMGAVPEIRQLG